MVQLRQQFQLVQQVRNEIIVCYHYINIPLDGALVRSAVGSAAGALLVAIIGVKVGISVGSAVGSAAGASVGASSPMGVIVGTLGMATAGQ